MTKVSSSHFRRAIEEHFDTLEYDVVCRKKKNAYAVYWADDEQPLARLRPTGRGDEVEVYRWDDGQWRQVNEFGLAMPLQECLEYITDDPEDLFFDTEDQIDAVHPGASPELAAAVRELHNHVFLCSILGGAAGGMFSGTVLGGMSGALAGILFSTACFAIQGKWRGILPHAVVVGIPVSLAAAVGGVLGGCVNGLLAHSIWGPIAGLVIGGLATLLMFAGARMARVVGFLAGLTLAASLVEMAGLREQFTGLALVALAASLSGALYAFLARQYVNSVMPILSPRVHRE